LRTPDACTSCWINLNSPAPTPCRSPMTPRIERAGLVEEGTVIAPAASRGGKNRSRFQWPQKVGGDRPQMGIVRFRGSSSGGSAGKREGATRQACWREVAPARVIPAQAGVPAAPIPANRPAREAGLRKACFWRNPPTENPPRANLPLLTSPRLGASHVLAPGQGQRWRPAVVADRRGIGRALAVKPIVVARPAFVAAVP